MSPDKNAKLFFKTVKANFEYLVKEYEYTISDVLLGPLQSAYVIIFRSKECAIAVVYHRRDIGLWIGANDIHMDEEHIDDYGKWVDISTAIAFARKLPATDTWGIDVDPPKGLSANSSMIWQIKYYAKSLKPYIPIVTPLFREDTLSKIEKKLHWYSERKRRASMAVFDSPERKQ